MGTDLTFLVSSAKTGSSVSFGKLYEYYAKDLYRFALYMLGNPSDAEDAVQEAVFSAWKHLPSLKEEKLFKAWLFKILANRCKKLCTKRGRSPEALPEHYEEFLIAEGEAHFSFKSCELLEALRSLTPPDGQLVLLCVIGGFTSTELAKIYGMPPATVRSRQKRALEKLRVCLSD